VTEYGFWSRLLHRLALGIRSVGEASFDLEKQSLAADLPDSVAGQHVFVVGLARSGTTVLMRSIYETGQFCSLTYRDMPFILAPNTWARLSQPGERHMSRTERAHADGVLVDFDSPEALEEVFWRVFAGEHYIYPDQLKAMRVSANLQARFRTYVSMILHRYQANRYLSKNNNNVLRLSAIASTFPQAVILVPFRQPEQQANSLFKQHQLFLEMHEQDKFSESYMQWLAHHEFGQDHRPFEWGLKLAEGLATDTLDYWLAQWVGVYGYIAEQLQQPDNRLVMVSYERLCADTQSLWQPLAARLNLDEVAAPTLEVRVSDTPPVTDRALLDKALEIYEFLDITCRQQLQVKVSA